MRVAVVGAGVVGASVAFHLAREGAEVVEVVMIDASGPASGTTSRSFAWVNANNKTPRSYFDLNLAGMREHESLEAELEGDWLRRTGNTIVSGDARELQARVARLSSWGYAARIVSLSEVERVEPEVQLSGFSEGVAAARFPEEPWADAPRLTRTLVGAARENGAKERFKCGVESLALSPEGVTLSLADGATLEADAAVNAAGPGAGEVARMVGRDLPLDVFSGLLVRVSAPGDPVRGLLHTPEVNVRPDGPGHVLLHHDSIDARLAGDFAGEVDPLCEELLERARRLVPSLRGSRVVEARRGERPVPGDGYSSVGGLPGLPGYYEASTHSGVTLGPLIGRLLAREVVTGEVDPLLASYRPERF